MKMLADRFFKHRTIPASVKLNGEYEDVLVEAEYQPEEWDTSTSEGVEVFCVWHEDNGNLIDEIEPADLRELEGKMLAEFGEYCADYRDGLAEHRAEMRRERLHE